MTTTTGPLETGARRLLAALAVAAALSFGGIGAASAAGQAEAPDHGAATGSHIGTPGQRAAEHEMQPRERMAAEGGHGDDNAHAEGGHGGEGEHKGGMPQLDATKFPTQIFWLVVAFGTLFYLMRRKALPRVEEILEARQERIAGDLDRAARLRDEAEAAQRQHEAVVAEARRKAQEQAKAVQDRVGGDIAERQAKLDADLGGRIDEAEARINKSRTEALAELQDVAASLAQVAVERLAGLRVSEAEAKDALGRVMREAA